MFYRENGQFKTTYSADQQIFPILQDKVAVLALVAFAFVGVPLLAEEYMFRAILIPFLILSLAAIGLNILVGYCGQVSLGTGIAFARANKDRRFFLFLHTFQVHDPYSPPSAYQGMFRQRDGVTVTDDSPRPLRDEVGELGIQVLRAAKATLDPAGILNPGKLIP